MNGNYLETPGGSLINSPSSLLLDSMTTSTQAFPWGLVLSLGIPLLKDLLGGEDDEEAQMFEKGMQMKNLLGMLGMKQPYQSPFTKAADQAVFNYLIQNMKRTGNWGWPSGMGIDLSFLDQLPGLGGGRVKKTY
jgi:hypothetical protein